MGLSIFRNSVVRVPCDSSGLKPVHGKGWYRSAEALRPARENRAVWGPRRSATPKSDYRKSKNALCEAFCGDALGQEGFDYVADLNVAVVGDGNSALHATAHFAGIVFEAAQ